MQIEREVARRSASGEYCRRLLGRLTAYGRRVVLVWLRSLHGMVGSIGSLDAGLPNKNRGVELGSSSGGGDTDSSEWAERVDAAVHDVFCRTRIDELFDMIHEFPDSERAVLELRTALEVTQQHGLLASVLRDTLQRRLLHPVGRQEG